MTEHNATTAELIAWARGYAAWLRSDEQVHVQTPLERADWLDAIADATGRLLTRCPNHEVVGGDGPLCKPCLDHAMETGAFL